MPYDPINGPKWRLRAQMLRERAVSEKNPELRDHLLSQARDLETKADVAERPPWQAGPVEPKE